jgi:hypothetical protein
MAWVALAGTGFSAEASSEKRSIAQAVDFFINDGLQRAGVTPSPLADDATVIRRVTLDLVGRIPTVAEMQAYLDSKDPAKRKKLIDRLVASPGFVAHQADEFDNLLMDGTEGSLRAYLVKAVGENRPWDKMFRELLVPDQNSSEGREAAKFLATRLKDTDRLTSDVSSTFFGVNISCAQCHDHPLVADWKQDHFYGMKAFLGRTFQNGADTDAFLGEHAYGSIKFKTTEGVEKQAKMMFLTGKRVESEGPQEATGDIKKAEKAELQKAKESKKAPAAPKFSARAKLVEIALSSEDREFFSRAVVNRIWNRLFGRGLVMPLDQMHSANAPSHPELLKWLASDMVAHGYDLRRLIRGLVESDAYARSTVWEGSEPPRPSLFAVANVRALTSVQLASSLRLATVDPASLPSDINSADFIKRVEAVTESGRPMAPMFKTAGGDSSIGVSEALLFSNNGDLSHKLLDDSGDRLLGRLKQISSPPEIVETAVRNILSRPADPEDLRVLGAYLAERTDRPDDAVRQLVWVLLTSAEFRFNH